MAVEASSESTFRRSWISRPTSTPSSRSLTRRTDISRGLASGIRMTAAGIGSRSTWEAEWASVATGGGFVYATVWRKFPRAVLMRSPVGHDDWTVLAEALDGFEGVRVDHDTVLLDKTVTLGGAQQILISHDEGANFTLLATTARGLHAIPTSPCPEPYGCSAAAVWRICSSARPMAGTSSRSPIGDGNPRDAPSLVGLSHSTLGAADATTAVIGSQELLGV